MKTREEIIKELKELLSKTDDRLWVKIHKASIRFAETCSEKDIKQLAKRF